MKGEDPTPRQKVESLLPSHYQVGEMMTGIIRCKSKDGLEDESQWTSFFVSIKQYFGNSLREVHHWTCYNHKDFTVYYDYRTLYNLAFDGKGNYTTQKSVNQ